ncbi:uncharacterized protein A4U43_C04F20460 [Asparagus officinalis]|uniref:Uncharacterized protein n=1 Tax=Asparagus officinalis TaxID=4686 RepID=A0A5P1F740_ASPOF|nr:uncharacterized protein A4U43_C04F20460 [Asparagus officinalis]
MASPVPLLLFIVLMISIPSSSSAFGVLGERRVGGRTEVRSVESNREIQDLGRFCVKQYNRKIRGPGSPLLSFSGVVSAERHGRFPGSSTLPPGPPPLLRGPGVVLRCSMRWWCGQDLHIIGDLITEFVTVFILDLISNLLSDIIFELVVILVVKLLLLVSSPFSVLAGVHLLSSLFSSRWFRRQATLVAPEIEPRSR